VLGALDPAERSRVDAHLATCAECRDELASLAGLPGLLGRVSRAEVEAEPSDPGPQLLDRLLNAAASERRRDRRRRWLTSVAAAVIALAAIGVAIGVSQDKHQSVSAQIAPPSVNPVSAPPGTSETFSATDPTTHVQASVTEWKKGWGASLEVTVTGVTADLAGVRCQLIAVGPDGKTDVAASWAAPSEGYTGTSKVEADGATALASTDITAFKVVGSDGATLVWVPATWTT